MGVLHLQIINERFGPGDLRYGDHLIVLHAALPAVLLPAAIPLAFGDRQLLSHIDLPSFPYRQIITVLHEQRVRFGDRDLTAAFGDELEELPRRIPLPDLDGPARLDDTPFGKGHDLDVDVCIDPVVDLLFAEL